MYGIGGMIAPRATPTPGQGTAPEPNLSPVAAAPASPAPVAAQGWQDRLYGSGDGSNAAALFGQGAVDADARAGQLFRQGNVPGGIGAVTSAAIQGAGGLIARPAAMVGQGIGGAAQAIYGGLKAFGEGLDPSTATVGPVAAASTASGGGMVPAEAVVPPAASGGSAVTGRSSSVIPAAQAASVPAAQAAVIPSARVAAASGAIAPPAGPTVYSGGDYKGQPLIVNLDGSAADRAPAGQGATGTPAVYQGRGLSPAAVAQPGLAAAAGEGGGLQAALGRIPNNQIGAFFSALSGLSAMRTQQQQLNFKNVYADQLTKAADAAILEAQKNNDPKALAEAKKQKITNLGILANPGGVANNALYGNGYGFGVE